MDEQLETFAEHLADLTTAPTDVWAHLALPVAVAINALNAAAGADDAPVAEPTDAPVVLARQLDAARRRRRTLATAS